MNAQLKPIEARCAERPTYDNTYLGWEADWIVTNREALLAWWNAGEKDDRDFKQFCVSQHEIEVSKREEFKRTLRQY